jgi:hypothetical protein
MDSCCGSIVNWVLSCYYVENAKTKQQRQLRDLRRKEGRVDGELQNIIKQLGEATAVAARRKHPNPGDASRLQFLQLRQASLVEALEDVRKQLFVAHEATAKDCVRSLAMSV